MQSPAYAFDGATADGHFQGHAAPQHPVIQEFDEEQASAAAFKWLGVLSVVVVLLIGSAVWWWQRGSDVHFKIVPADAAVTLDGAPLAVVNGEATVPALKRGFHMLVAVPPQGGSLHQSVDVSFLEASQDVVVTFPGSERAFAAKRRR